MNITLPRELVEQAIDALKFASGYCDTYAEIDALQSALSQSVTECHHVKPLSDDQIEEMANDFEEGYVFLYRSFARAIEAAHGIGVTNE